MPPFVRHLRSTRLWHRATSVEPLLILAALAVIGALVLVERQRGRSSTSPGARSTYPGDHRGRVDVQYAPSPDGRPDPGEIVWTWVPFEEDHSRGKDRPVLLIGRDGPWLLGVQLSSQDHHRNAAQEAHRGRHWLAIGTGPWDGRRRPSAVRLDRIVRVDPGAVRREGAVLGQRRFDEVARSLSALHHW